jgi:hypothetical protein
MVSIIGMAALSIDVITLYLAKEEAQRSADAAALAAARIISVSGITGDPTNKSNDWSLICGGSGSAASKVAQAVVQQNAVGRRAANSVNVTYSAASGGATTSNADCALVLAAAPAFGLNPMVTVQVQQAALPTFFSHIWGNTASSVSATATAEAFNPSNSGNVGNTTPVAITPVQPRCVKPWVVPNRDPLNPVPAGGHCPPSGAGACLPIVNTDGSIKNSGISTGGSSTTGIIGETFWLVADCKKNPTSQCKLQTVLPQANYANSGGPPNLLYVPGQVGTPVTAVPSCTLGNEYEEAIEGCDAPTNYQCGVQNQNVVDLTVNPIDPTSDGVQCLIQQGNTGNITGTSGQDYLSPFAAPSTYPFQILAGSNSPLGKAGLAANGVSSSPSIVSLPIYDQAAAALSSNTATNVTFVGFLQVFINAVDANGNVNVTVLNVAGCGDGSTAPNAPVSGSSPVPVRLITPP